MRAKSAADKTNKDPGTDKGPKTDPDRQRQGGRGEEQDIAKKCLSKEKKTKKKSLREIRRK